MEDIQAIFVGITFESRLKTKPILCVTMWLLKPEFSSVVETDSRKMLYLDIFYLCNHKTIKEENCKSLIFYAGSVT